MDLGNYTLAKSPLEGGWGVISIVWIKSGLPFDLSLY